MNTAIEIIKYMFTPYDSESSFIQAAPTWPYLGPIKALVWMGLAIVAGLMIGHLS